MVTIQGTGVDELIAEVASVLRTAATPLILVIGYRCPQAELEAVLAAARTLDQEETGGGR